VPSVGGQRVVEKRFENVVEEILILPIFAVRQPPEEIAGAGAPFLALFDTEPALLLQEIQKHDLAQELFGKVHGADAHGLEFVPDHLVPWQPACPALL
jgi:hypothetical protein